MFSLTNPLARHSRAGGNPASANIPRSGQHRGFVRFAGNSLIIWIPACAGMTEFCADGPLGHKAFAVTKSDVHRQAVDGLCEALHKQIPQA
jgi:hypothetical protein